MTISASEPIYLLIFLIIAAMEMGWRKWRRKSYDWRAFGATAVILIGQNVSRIATYAVIGAVLFLAFQLSPVHWDLGAWQTWAAGFVIMEFTYYWQHRFGHTIRWMWANHAVHHSPNEFVLPAAFRLGWTGFFTGSWLVYVPVALLGFHPLMIVTLLTINLRFQFFLHTEEIGRLGILDRVFNTPSNHRVHHSARPEYLDKNFGGMTMIFDHLFSTYAAEKPGIDLRYGLTDPIKSHNPLVIVFREWGRLLGDVRRAHSPGEAWRAAFGRPADMLSPQAPRALTAPGSEPRLQPPSPVSQPHLAKP